MALHWAHIKGFNGPTGATGPNYTWINFMPQRGTTETSDDLPELKISESTTEPTTSYGHIFGSNCLNKMTRNCQWSWYDSNNNVEYGIQDYQGDLYIYGITGSSYSPIAAFHHISNNDLWKLYTDLYVLGSTTVDSNLTVNGTTSINNILNTKSINTTGNIAVSGHIDATYFNSTSDRRAKINIQPVTLSVLDFIKKTPIYTFNYKWDVNKPLIGIMAQDIQSYKINDFTLVENSQATGENNDFMSIHESKLVFVLWKAVQELTAKVEELEQQLK